MLDIRALIIAFFLFSISTSVTGQQKVFDVHAHGSKDIGTQLNALSHAGVYKVAVSSSWDLQQQYTSRDDLQIVHGLMVPCPNGKVPYSGQLCFSDGSEYPPLDWVEDQIKEGKIDFIGEVLSQYYGISSSDSTLMPYYALASKYNIPVGIHTGSAGPDHGSPNFKEEMGNPKLMEKLLTELPGIRLWIMHAGAPYHREAITIMKITRMCMQTFQLSTIPKYFLRPCLPTLSDYSLTTGWKTGSCLDQTMATFKL